MRLLHTSDWHLGRTLHRADLREAQAGFLTALVETVRAGGVDVVVVAGDVYDRAIPPLDAVELFQDALVRLRATGARVVVSSGNHDSATRLGFASPLLDAAGVHLRTRPGDLASPLIIKDAHGAVGVYAIPYLEPEAVRTCLPDLGDARGHVGVLGHAAALIASDAAARGLTRTVVAAHAWVSGAQSSDSERDITVGGVAAVPAELFAGFTYTALGHLHGAQRVSDSIRYSGSPMPYSFSEAHHVKGWYLVDLDAHGLAHVEQVAAPVHRPLSALRGDLDVLLTRREHAVAESHFVSVTLTDAARPVEAMDRLRRRFPHVLSVAWEPSSVPTGETSYAARVRNRDDLDIAASFIEHVRHAPATGAERGLLRAAIDAVRIGSGCPEPATPSLDGAH